MGMYTELRFDARLSKAGVRAVQALNEGQNKRGSAHDPSPWYAAMPLIVDIAKELGTDLTAPVGYLNQTRKNFIPFGNHSEHRAELDGDVWRVTCELKNYTATIEQFLKDVLPLLIAEPVTVYTHYEEDTEPRAIEVRPPPKPPEASDVG